MNEQLTNICEQFIRNRDILKNTFTWDSMYIIPVCAAMLCGRGIEADADGLKQCRKALEQNTSIFSNFRGNIKLPMVAMLASAADPLDKLQASMAIYSIMKNHFYGSDYLAYVSSVLTDMISRERADEIAARGKQIYQLMKSKHPFLTSNEDSVFAVLMAFSEKSNDDLILDMETCYQLLKQRFRNSNAVQSLSHVLALAEGSSEMKCERFFSLFDAMRKAGKAYGESYEISALGSLSLLSVAPEILVQEIVESDDFLSEQKGYGFFGIDKRTRLMHSVMLVSILHTDTDMTNTAAMTSTLAMVAAQQAAMCAVIASTAAATAASN